MIENEREDEMYFMLEVNLVSNFVRFVGEPFKHIQNMGFSIENVRPPFRIGVSFVSGSHNGIGLGLVKLN